MDDRSQEIEAIFLAALEKISPQERAAYIEGTCAGNRELLEQVQELLESHEDSHGPLDARPAVTEDTPGVLGVAERPGTVIGNYKLLQNIGEGGMGVVFMAAQTRPVERRVALKIIKPGMDTRQVIARFEAERQALAMMDHPNIAKVLDAGKTESGRPFFVMELVKGVPLTKYCDEKRLTPEERMELFVPVCQAVQHAHQKGIIHRDIKPSNVLVAEFDDDAVPKIIDFGVAKAVGQRLTQKTLFTEYGQIVGTIDYMSPEQAKLNQLDIDTRSDIYSLGVLLYELLTGETPFDRARLRSAAFDEMLRIIRDEEPPRPSIRLSAGASLPSAAANRHVEPKKLSALIRGELDWIIMKAMEKDRSRRYETANALANDITRHLRDEPVAACPPSLYYRLNKSVRRHRGLIASAASFLIMLIVALGITSIALFKVDRARRDAREATRQAVVASENEAEQRVIAERNAKEAQWHLYVARQFPLIDAWRSKSFGLLDRRLNESAPPSGQPDFRGWEYTYFRDQCRQKFETLQRDASAMALNPAADEVAIASGTGDIVVRSTSHWGVDRTLKLGAREADLWRLAWSPDGRTLACGYRDGAVVFCSAQTGVRVRELDAFKDAIRTLSWHPDGKLLAVTSWNTRENEVRIFDAATGQLVKSLSRRMPTPHVWIAEWSPDGTRLASGHGRFLHVWDTETWEVAGFSRMDGNPVMSFEWDGQGNRLAASRAGHLHMLDKNGKFVSEFPVDVPLKAMCWITETEIAVGGGDQTLSIIDVDMKAKREVLPIHIAPITHIAVTPDRVLVSHDQSGVVRASHATRDVSPATVMTLNSPAAVTSIAWEPSEKRLLAGAKDGSVRVFDTHTGALIASPPTVCSRFVTWVDSLGPISANHDGSAVLWDATFSQARSLVRRSHPWSTFSISPNGKWAIVSPTWHDTVVFDVGRRVLVDTVKGCRQAICDWLPDSSGAFIVMLNEDKTFFWRVDRQDETDFPLGCSAPNRSSVDVSTAGDTLVVGCPDGKMHFVDAESGEAIVTVAAHSGGVGSIDWLPDDSRIATAGSDGLVKIWDGATATELLTLPRDDQLGFAGVKWSKDGRRLAAYGGDKVFIFGSPNIEKLTRQPAKVETGPISEAKAQRH